MRYDAYSMPLPPEQESIRAKCVHPTRQFIDFKKAEIEKSIPDRFEEQVDKYRSRLAIKTGSYAIEAHHTSQQ